LIAELKRRGKKLPGQEEASPRRQVEDTAVSLTPGKLNAVRAALKAGVTPSKIARQFGMSQSEVRKALAGSSSKSAKA
jgi:predicted transcriptional regulator